MDGSLGNKSPLIKTPTVGMTFPEAMEKVIEGKMVKRLEWDQEGGKDHYCFLSKITRSLVIKKGRGVNLTVAPMEIREGDMLPNDWIVVAPVAGE